MVIFQAPELTANFIFLQLEQIGGEERILFPANSPVK